MTSRNREKKHDRNATKQDEDDATSRGSANGRPQGARKCKDITEAGAERREVEKGRGELIAALGISEGHLGTGTRSYGSEDGACPSRVKKSPVARALAFCLEERSAI